ncbi:hypothetical protein HOY82DRAFT_619596 [Tuber indicum]|nr:hypothetical protein HOY82DRAFT_619596 [Tuber indicum]
MARMLAEYDLKISYESKENETAQTDGEYEQTMAEGKKRVETSGDGGSSGMGQKGKENKKKEECLAVAHHQKLLSTIRRKRSYQSAITALDAHYASEEEKDIAGISSGSGSLQNIEHGGVKTLLRDKRRKIMEREEYLDASLAEESHHQTGILEQVTTDLVPAEAGTSSTKFGQPGDREKQSAQPEMTETWLKSFEKWLETAEEALENVK